MPSREVGLAVRVVLLVLAAAFAVGNLWMTLARSTIPLALEGAISEIELRFEKNRGVDDVYLVTVGDRTIHVDTVLGRRLSRGDELHKDAWSRQLLVDGEPVPLSPSLDFRRMLAAMPLVGIAAAVLALGPRRRTAAVRPPGAGPPKAPSS